MFRLLVLLCLSLYCAMSVYGNGPPRTERYARSEPAAALAESGIRILPAPERILRATTKPAAQALTKGWMTQAARHFSAPRTQASVPKVVPALPANVQIRWISAGTANVRTEPSKRSDLSGTISRGGAVHVMWNEPNGWVRIRSAAGDVTGFVHKSLLTTNAPPVAEVDLALEN